MLRTLLWTLSVGLFSLQPLMGVIVYVEQPPNDYNTPGANAAGRVINVELVRTDETMTLHAFPNVRTVSDEQTIVSDQLADIQISDTTVTKKIDEVKTDKKIEIEVTITSNPDPTVDNGYQLFLEILTLRFSLDVTNSEFFLYQSNRLISEATGLLYPPPPIRNNQRELIYQNIQFSDKDAKTYLSIGEGIAAAQDWKTDAILQFEDTKGTTTKTKTKFTLSIPFTSIEGLANGDYWFVLNTIMDPFQKETIEEEATNLSNRAEVQINQRNNYISSIDGILEDRNSLNGLSTDEIAILNKNKKLLQDQVNEIYTDVNDELTTLSKDPTATPSDQALIAEKQADLLTLAQEQKSVPS